MLRLFSTESWSDREFCQETETLTGLLGGDIDGWGLGSRPRRVEGAHRQVVLGAAPQAADVHCCVVG